MNVIEVHNISKSFREGFREGFSEKQVLNGISLTVGCGEFVVLRGVNGAGKTTLLNIILGLLKPNRGEVKLFARSPDQSESKNRIGVVLQKVTVPKHLKVKELINLLRSYYPNPISNEEILSTVNLAGKHDYWASELSGGEEQRLYFALALAGNPDLLILDEPTRNLDSVIGHRSSVIVQLFFPITNHQSPMTHHHSSSVDICDRKAWQESSPRTS